MTIPQPSHAAELRAKKFTSEAPSPADVAAVLQLEPASAALECLVAEDAEQRVMAPNVSGVRAPAITMVGFLISIYVFLHAGESGIDLGFAVMNSLATAFVLFFIVAVVGLFLNWQTKTQDERLRIVSGWVRLLRARADEKI